jgi:ATP-binding cassette, subfamily B, bacterial
MNAFLNRASKTLKMINRPALALLLTLTAITSIVSAIEPMLLRAALDTLTLRRAYREFTVEGSIMAIAAVLLLVTMLRVVLGRLSGWFATALRVGIERSLFSACSESLYNLSLDYHEETPVGQIAEKLRRGTQGLTAVVYDLTVSLMPNLLYVALTLYFMTTMDGTLTLIACFFAVVPSVLGAHASGGKARREEVLQSIWQEVYSRFYGGLKLIVVIKSFSQERSEHERFVTKLESGDNLLLDGFKRDSWSEISKSAAIEIGKVVVLGYGGLLVLRGKISIGSFAAFYSYCGGLFQPMLAIASMIESLRRSHVYLKLLFDIIEAPNGVTEMPNARRLHHCEGMLRFEGVSVRRGEGMALDDVSFHARAGQVLAFVGEVGSGKSTITKCAMRFLDPDKGSVTLDGHNLRELQLSWLRGTAVGLVQATALWDGSVFDNIEFGRPGATFDEVVAAAKAAGAHDFIEEKTEQYEYQVGEGGCRLSSGQCQLIALARLLLADPQIVILDEVTSNLDPNAEDALVRMTIDTLVARGKTVIVVAHRLSSIRTADRILVMKGGRVVEEGTHRELMSKAGLYFEFVGKQALTH